MFSEIPTIFSDISQTFSQNTQNFSFLATTYESINKHIAPANIYQSADATLEDKFYTNSLSGFQAGNVLFKGLSFR